MGKGEAQLEGITLVSLVFLVPKKGPKLWQLVIDQCCLNLVLAELHYKFGSLVTLVWLAGWGWWAITFDLAQGYHHISIHPDLLQWFGFHIDIHGGAAWWGCEAPLQGKTEGQRAKGD